MRQLILGILIGATLTGGLVSAGNFYTPSGQVAAPPGSQQRFDYYRQRQQYLDIGKLREQAERDRTSITSPDRIYRRSPC